MSSSSSLIMASTALVAYFVLANGVPEREREKFGCRGWELDTLSTWEKFSKCICWRPLDIHEIGS